MKRFYFSQKIVLILAMVFAGSLQTKAQLLGWYFNADKANNGDEASINAPIVDPNLETSTLTRGADLTQEATFSRSFMSTFPANAAENRTTSLSKGTYLQFTLQPKEGKKASLTTLRYKLRTGGINFGYQWAYSTDNWATHTLLGSNATVTDPSPFQGVFGPDVDLSGIAALQNITSDKTVIFRLYIWGGHTVNRNFAIGRSGDSITEPDVVLSVSGATETLPVSLLSFDAASTIAGNRLDWVTAAEKNSDYFDVLRSSDNQSFVSIGIKKAQGNTDAKSSYSFTDRNPLQGTNYYKLKQVDADGNSVEYGPVAVNGNTVKDAVLKVALAGDEVQVNINVKEKSANGVLTISDINGRSIYRQGVALEVGENQIKLTHNLDKGKVYLISLKTDKVNETVKFIR